MRDNGLEVLSFLLEQLAQFVVLLDRIFVLDFDGVSLLFRFFEFCLLAMPEGNDSRFSSTGTLMVFWNWKKHLSSMYSGLMPSTRIKLMIML